MHCACNEGDGRSGILLHDGVHLLPPICPSSPAEGRCRLIALFHFHVTQIKRSAGQSAIAAAAYRAGEKLHSEYYGDNPDYTCKGGVVCSEILLPAHAPPRLADRETLWNEVEKVEQHPKAQLAYSFDIALQNEFSMEENRALVRQFLLDEFVSRGMIVDYAIHETDVSEGGIQNPHFHVLCPIRPLNPDGTWGTKQRRQYILDEHGNRIPNGKGDYEFKAVPTTDWGSPERLEAWRQAWSNLCNAKFEEKGLPCRIDNRSYARQGVEQIPTVHEGPAVRQMEARGIATDKGNLNRLIRATNQRLKEIARRIKELLQGIAEIKAQMEVPQSPVLAGLLKQRMEQRNAGAWSDKAKVGNLKEFAHLILLLQERGIVTLDDFETYMSKYQEKSNTMTAVLKAKSERMKELSELIRFAGEFKRLAPIYEEWNNIKFKKAREKYRAEHEREISLFLLAKRKLDAAAPDHKIPVNTWQKELDSLTETYAAESERLKPVRAELKELYKIKSKIEPFLREETQDKNTEQRKETYAQKEETH